MHLLPCPNCQTPLSVAPSQAGDQIRCPSCQADVAIPKLGDLRRLPVAEPPPGGRSQADAPVVARGPSAATIGFVVLGLIATVSLLIAGFSTIRWAMLEAPETSQSHIETLREEYGKVNAAQLIREYEVMERYGLEMPSPYKYKQQQLIKSTWGRNALIAGTLAAVAVLGAVALALSVQRSGRTVADT